MAEGLDKPKAPTSNCRWPSPTAGEYVIRNFDFDAGGTLPRLRLHYQTLGIPRASPGGQTTNAVLIMHGTGGSGSQFLNDHFAGELFGPGQPLDARVFFIVLRDGIGHGRSSRPGDADDDAAAAAAAAAAAVAVAGPAGGHARGEFPHYRYSDMVRADWRLLTEHLGVNHLRLVMGTSMGGMHSWLWGETYPDFMDALMPLASLPVQISGRNRMWRKMAMDAITLDLASQGVGLEQQQQQQQQQQQPQVGLTTALSILTLVSSSPLQYQEECPTRDAADGFVEDRIRSGLESTDARDLLYALGASWDYDPKPGLHKIKVPLLAVNTADDQINPPELGILEREVEQGLVNCPWKKAVVLPITKDTRGHGSHTWAVLWKNLLQELLAETDKPHAQIVRSVL